MTRRLAQSTAYTVTAKMFLASDHLTAATGKTVSITLSKAGAAFANPAAGASTMTEIGSTGIYKFALGTSDVDTLGDLIIHASATLCDDTDQIAQVVSATTGGATNLDAAITTVTAKTALIPGTQDGKTFAETVLLMASVLLGKASGMATTTAVFRGVNDGKDRVTATVDSSGNRTAVTLDAS